jgi:hypothetical protein
MVDLLKKFELRKIWKKVCLETQSPDISVSCLASALFFLTSQV